LNKEIDDEGLLRKLYESDTCTPRTKVKIHSVVTWSMWHQAMTLLHSGSEAILLNGGADLVTGLSVNGSPALGHASPLRTVRIAGTDQLQSQKFKPLTSQVFHVNL
jgi:hypothetical protein